MNRVGEVIHRDNFTGEPVVAGTAFFDLGESALEELLVFEFVFYQQQI
jgi:hypothetical protein